MPIDSDKSQIIRAGTRGSQLALWQTEFVISRLSTYWPQMQFVAEVVQSRGDRDKSTPLPALGGKGLFTAELEEGLRNGSMDIAVHSLKDLPIEDPPGLVTAAILARDEVRDVWISRNGQTLDEIPANAVIGTSSTRRCAQLLARRPDLQVRSIRGNVDTRLRKLDDGEYDAIILAGAGIVRMGLANRVTQWLPVEWFTPAPGQGALGVQCRADDKAVRELLEPIHDLHLARLVAAERGFLAALGGGCSEPVGAYAQWRHPAQAEEIDLYAWYSTPDGQIAWSQRNRGADPASVASESARAAQLSVGISHSHRKSPTTTSLPRVAITRSTTRNQDELRALLSAGIQPIVTPVLDMAPQLSPQELVQAIGEPARFGWVIFTSANAVRIFAELWAAAGGENGIFSHMKAAAVGPHTAQAAEEAGWRVDFVPEVFSGEGLGEHADRFGQCEVLLPRSVLGDPHFVETLVRHGASVTEIPLYAPETRQLDKYAVAALEHGVDLITFASASAVEAFQTAIEPHATLRHLMQQVPIACIGPQTARAVRREGIEPALVSEVHTMPGLIDAVIGYLGNEAVQATRAR